MGTLSAAQHGLHFVYVADFRASAAAGGTLAEYVEWHLVANNNRLLGCSSRSYWSYGECRDAVAFLQVSIAELTRSIVFDVQQGTWGWTYYFDDTPLARSARAFGTRVACLNAAEQFLRSARSAHADSRQVLRRQGAPASRRGRAISGRSVSAP